MRTRAHTLSDELVRAALADRLSELVVPMRPHPGVIRLGGNPHWVWPPCVPERTTDRKTWTIGCPLGAVGDRLWFREAWAPCREATQDPPESIWFRADMSRWSFEALGRWRNTTKTYGITPPQAWRSALQLPRDASRLLYEITALRCERLQHVTADGARLRGFDSVHDLRAFWDRASVGRRPRAPRDGESWDENPWVFVASVRRVEMAK